MARRIHLDDEIQPEVPAAAEPAPAPERTTLPGTTSAGEAARVGRSLLAAAYSAEDLASAYATAGSALASAARNASTVRADTVTFPLRSGGGSPGGRANRALAAAMERDGILPPAPAQPSSTLLASYHMTPPHVDELLRKRMAEDKGPSVGTLVRRFLGRG